MVSSQENFTDYIPKKNSGTDQVLYNRGKHMLINNYQNIKEHKGRLNYANYWNTAFAFAHMGVGRDTILGQLIASKKMNRTSFCYIANAQIESNEGEPLLFHTIVGNMYLELINDCKDIKLKKILLKDRFKEKEALDLTGLNEKLINQLIKLMDKDQFYRFGGSWNDKQRSLDREVQKELTTIFEKYGYPSKKLVGEHYMNDACLMLEHGGELSYQEKYFPLVAEALKKGEVEKNYVRMLIDRIHWKKTGKQIFGSHSGVAFETNEVINQIKKKYNL